MPRCAKTTLIVLSFVYLAFGTVGSGLYAQDGVIFRRDHLKVVTESGAHVFQVEMAETPRQRTQGLMWRRHLPESSGMLFDFGNSAPVVMWMKNTYVPLDMIFITANGTILNIARDTVPESTAFINSGGPVRGVLEVPAGTTARLGIRPGHRIDHSWFNRP